MLAAGAVGGGLHAVDVLLAGDKLLVLDEALNLFFVDSSPESFLPSTFLFDLLTKQRLE